MSVPVVCRRRARPALVCLCVVGAALLCTPCSGTWALITVFCLLQHLPSRGSQSVLQTLINLASQPSCEVGGGCHPAVQMRTLSCSGTVASLLPLKPGEAVAPSRPSRSLAPPAEGRAVLHDPEMARAYSELLHCPAPLSFLQSWFPAGPAAPRLKEGLSLWGRTSRLCHCAP